MAETDRCRSVPALPDHINGRPVTRWTPWRAAMLLSHIDPACSTCADPGPPVLARGYTLDTVRGHQVELYRWHAHRCPACDEMRIYESRPTGTGFTRQVEVLYGPPATHQDTLFPAQEAPDE